MEEKYVWKRFMFETILFSELLLMMKEIRGAPGDGDGWFDFWKVFEIEETGA